MKKYLLALVALAAMATAQAQVTVYGKVNQYYNNTKTGTAGSDTAMTSDLSNIGFRATEDLGGGLKANVTIETLILANDPNNGAATKLGDRQSTVGLSNKFGSVDLGRKTHGLFGALASNDPFGHFIGSVSADVHNTRDLRFSNGTFLTTNVGPARLSYDRSTGDVSGTDAFAVGASADIGPVVASYARYEKGTEKTDLYAARAQFGGTGIFASYSDNQGATPTKGSLVGASQKLGATPVTVKASWAQVQNGIKAYNVGAEYAFSKRTTAQAVYRNVEGVTNAGDIRQVAVGLQHVF
jgi:predicted porin